MKMGYVFLFLFLFGCSSDEFVAENPYDPTNPDYIPPIVSIVSGLTDNQVIDSESITVSLQGNESSMLYRTKLDSLPWSGWLTTETFLLDYLDEGNHHFYFQGKYLTDDTSDIYIIPFEVDAVSGPSIMTFPRRRFAEQGDTLNFQIQLEEVYDVSGVEFTLHYDPNLVNLISIDQGDIFKNLGSVIYFEDLVESDGVLTINNAVWGGQLTGFNGTGYLIDVSFVSIQNTSSEVILEEVTMRDSQNQNIILNNQISGYIEIN